MSEFTGKTVYVTGAAGNLGQAVTQRFLDQGAQVIALDLSNELLDTAFSKKPENLSTFAADLLDRPALAALFDNLATDDKTADILCALTGGFTMGDPVHATPTDQLDLMFQLNVHTLVNSVSAAVPHMRQNGGGKIVTVGANAALNGIAGMGAYCASKSAVMKLTESMSAELKIHGFNVNGVLPSIIDTPQNRTAMPDADPKNWVSPNSLADVICHLSSDAARDIHGALVPVTGLS